jgi:hypothetical protein
MSETHDVGAIWDVLGSEPIESSGNLRAAPVGVSSMSGAILAGVDDAGNRHILFPLFPGEAFTEDSKRQNVQLVGFRHNGVFYASAVCISRDFDDIFGQFAHELVSSLRDSSSPAREALRALRRWQLLFSDAPSAGLLSENEVIGLFAELLALREIVSANGMTDTACWTGPDRSQHDFRGSDWALEVKASLARGGRRLTISSIDQLDPPPNSSLFLAFFRLEKFAGGETVGDLVESIQSSGVNPERFGEQLLSWGYRAADAYRYDAKFRITEQKMYRIPSDHFPRLTKASFIDSALPPGVVTINYVIDLSNEPPFPIEDAKREEIFKLFQVES